MKRLFKFSIAAVLAFAMLAACAPEFDSVSEYNYRDFDRTTVQQYTFSLGVALPMGVSNLDVQPIEALNVVPVVQTLILTTSVQTTNEGTTLSSPAFHPDIKTDGTIDGLEIFTFNTSATTPANSDVPKAKGESLAYTARLADATTGDIELSLKLQEQGITCNTFVVKADAATITFNGGYKGLDMDGDHIPAEPGEDDYVEQFTGKLTIAANVRLGVTSLINAATNVNGVNWEMQGNAKLNTAGLTVFSGDALGSYSSSATAPATQTDPAIASAWFKLKAGAPTVLLGTVTSRWSNAIVPLANHIDTTGWDDATLSPKKASPFEFQKLIDGVWTDIPVRFDYDQAVDGLAAPNYMVKATFADLADYDIIRSRIKPYYLVEKPAYNKAGFTARGHYFQADKDTIANVASTYDQTWKYNGVVRSKVVVVNTTNYDITLPTATITAGSLDGDGTHRYIDFTVKTNLGTSISANDYFRDRSVIGSGDTGTGGGGGDGKFGLRLPSVDEILENIAIYYVADTGGTPKTNKKIALKEAGATVEIRGVDDAETARFRLNLPESFHYFTTSVDGLAVFILPGFYVRQNIAGGGSFDIKAVGNNANELGAYQVSGTVTLP